MMWLGMYEFVLKVGNVVHTFVRLVRKKVKVVFGWVMYNWNCLVNFNFVLVE